MRFLAFDPGDVWLGFAALQIDTETGSERRPVTEMHTVTRVLHVPSHNFTGAVREALFYGLGKPAIVIAEDYRMRPVGHQRFNAGLTLRMLGALEYATSQYPKSSWVQVPPGNSERELPQLLGPTFFPEWQTSWANPKDANWRHALSAWRVLARYLMKEHATLLQQIRRVETHETMRLMPHWLPFQTQRINDLSAPAARWTLAELPAAKRRR